MSAGGMAALLVAAVISNFWAGPARTEPLQAVAAPTRGDRISGGTELTESRAREFRPWLRPAANRAQSRAADLFSPAETAAEPESESANKPQPANETSDSAKALSHVRLIALRPEIDPIRMIGHVSEGLAPRGVFEDRGSSETFIAGLGPVAGREIEIVELSLAIEPPGATDEREDFHGGAVATLRLPGADGDVLFREGRPRETGRMRATFDLEEGEGRELGVGEILETAAGAFRLDAIDAGLGRVKITWLEADTSAAASAWLTLAQTESVAFEESAGTRE